MDNERHGHLCRPSPRTIQPLQGAVEFRRWRANAAGVSGATVPRGISQWNREAVEGRAMCGSPPATASRFDCNILRTTVVSLTPSAFAHHRLNSAAASRLACLYRRPAEVVLDGVVVHAVIRQGHEVAGKAGALRGFPPASVAVPAIHNLPS